MADEDRTPALGNKKDVRMSGLKISIALTIVFFFVEIYGVYISGSLALLSDATHMLRDVFAMVLSLVAIRLSGSLPTPERTYGFHRLEILAAFINGAMLIILSIFIFIEAYGRLIQPAPVSGGIMLGVAIMGLIVNLIVLKILYKNHEDLNINSVLLHVAADTLASFGVIGGAVWIFYTGQTIVDPLISIVIGIIVVLSAIPLIRDSLVIMLQYTPKGIDINEVIREIESVEGVKSIHHVHLWALCSKINIFDAHILTDKKDIQSIQRIKSEIREKMKRYNVRHSTLEIDFVERDGDDLFRHIQG